MEYFMLIDARGIEAWHSARNGIERAAAFSAADPEAATRLRGWLANTRSRCIPVADLADERHLIERLPRVSRADRRLLIDRRLAQHFPDTPITHAGPQPSAPEDGLLEPMLLAALTRPAHLAPWLEILGEAGSRGQIDVRALTSVPFLLEHWYRRQRMFPAQSLLLAPGADGMRQIFFRQRRLAFSRVIPARSDTLAGCLPVYRDELAQTLAWLSSQRLSDGPPPVSVLATADDLPILREIASPAGDDISFIDPARHMRANTGISSSAFAISALALQEARRAGAFGHHPGCYRCPQLRRARRIAGTRRIAIALGMALTASGLGAAAVDFTAAARLHDETAQLAARQRILQDEIDKLDASAARLPGVDEFAAWLDTGERLIRATGIAPATVLQAVADLLAEAPWAHLETLAWERAQNGHAPALLPEFAAKDFPSGDTASAIVALEISLDGNAPPPQAAAAALSAHWQRLHGNPMQAQPGIDTGTALLRLQATLLPPDAMTSTLQTSAR
jgi:hypothetical protein